MRKKAVLFDLDDTLLWDKRSVKEAFERTCAEAAREANIDAEELERAVRREARVLFEGHEAYPFTQMIGINPFEGLWAEFREGRAAEFRLLEMWAPHYRKEAWTRGLKALGVDDPAMGERLGERFRAHRRSLPYVYEDTFDVLNALKGKVKLLLLTNGAPDLQKEKLAGVPELSGYFDHIVISGDFGRGKPDPAIFRHALSLLGVPAADAVMIGDKLSTDILGAGRVGMDSIWINRSSEDVGDGIRPTATVSRLSEVLRYLE